MAKATEPQLARGVYAALATPRQQDSLEADTAALLDYIDNVMRAGVDGLVLFGSTGEFVHFDVPDRTKVITFAIRRSRVPVLVNVSHSNFQGAIDLAEHAIEAGASGLLLMPPYFYRYNDEQIFHFYDLFIQQVRGQVPVYLYNLPFFTNPLSERLVAQLLSTGWFAGIKDSSGDWRFFEALLALHKTLRFQLLVGNESIYVRGSRAGAQGIVSGVAASIPELLVAIHRALCTSNLDRAEQLDRRLQEFVVWIDKFPSTVAIKQAAVARKWKQDHFAVPPDPVTSSALAEFHHWLAQWLPAVLSECAKKA